MRTKTFLITAALSVAAATSWAQVYSVNAVGYVNITVPVNQFALIANPLNGTNNQLNTILPLPEEAVGTLLYSWDNNTQSLSSDPPTWLGSAAGWFNSLGPVTTPLDPGQAVFIQALGAPAGATTLNITFVGEVPQGTLVNTLAGLNKFSFLSSIVPQAAPVGAPGAAGTLELPSEVGDLIYLFEAGAYTPAYTSLGGGVWVDKDGVTITSGPTIPVAAGFVFQQISSSGTSWTRTFNVN